MTATRPHATGYAAIGKIAIALILLSPAAVGHASSIAFESIGFGRAVTLSTRVVKAKVTGRSEVKVDGGEFRSVDVTVEAVLKGAPAKRGESIRVFDGAKWFQHTHAAALKGGVVSYADPHYAMPIPDAELKPGAVVIVFLRGEAPPPGFPANAAFLSCGQGWERPARAADVARMKTAAFGDPITLKRGEVAVLPDGLELEFKAHAHKRPVVGGPQKEMAELEARSGRHSDLVVLGHVVAPSQPGRKPRETWEKRAWQQYDLILVGMNYDADTTLRVLRRNQ